MKKFFKCAGLTALFLSGLTIGAVVGATAESDLKAEPGGEGSSREDPPIRFIKNMHIIIEPGDLTPEEKERFRNDAVKACKKAMDAATRADKARMH